MDSSMTNLLLLLGTGFILHTFLGSSTTENYWGTNPPMTVKAQKVVQSASGPANGFYEIPGYYQAALSPRFSNTQYGAYINYNMPEKNMLAVDNKNPLTLASMAYSPIAATASAFQQPTILKENFAGCGSSSQQSQQMQQAAMSKAQNYTTASDMLPVQGMGNGNGMQAINALGEASVQPVIYDRYIFANQKSRLQKNGDYIRGDLPIVPNQSGWFQVSVHPQIDLNAGAMLAMGGASNNTSQQLQALRSSFAGSGVNTGGGVNFSVQQSPYTQAAGGDIMVTAFP